MHENNKLISRCIHIDFLLPFWVFDINMRVEYITAMIYIMYNICFIQNIQLILSNTKNYFILMKNTDYMYIPVFIVYKRIKAKKKIIKKTYRLKKKNKSAFPRSSVVINFAWTLKNLENKTNFTTRALNRRGIQLTPYGCL